jgi:hypothetical protein
MKTYARLMATVAMNKCGLFFIIYVMTVSNVFGEIKNGYERRNLQTRESLKNLLFILAKTNDMSAFQRREIKERIEELESDILYYELTENLLDQFRIIAPMLYNEIDTIKDNKGRAVHVYVKFVPEDATVVKAWGTTYISQVEGDVDAYRSEYGDLTVSVKIWIVNNALKVLAHELGHVKYQVPHLASYCKFYEKHYFGGMRNLHIMGHGTNDPSGKSAWKYENIFRKEYSSVLKRQKHKIQNPVVLVERIKRNLNNNIINLEPTNVL